MFRSCMYTPTSMLLKFVLKTQNYFTKFPSSKTCCFSCFRLTGRPARSTGASARTCTVCACLSVDRPVDPTVNSLLSGFLGRPPGRPREGNCVSFVEDGRPDGRPEPNGSLPTRRRSTDPVDRQACKSPTALSSLVQF